MARVQPMARSVLADAFDHHVWATLRVIDVSSSLTSEQLEQVPVPGVYGPLLKTLRHLVIGDRNYLAILTAGEVPVVDDTDKYLAELKQLMLANGAAWAGLVERQIDPEAVAYRRRPGRLGDSRPRWRPAGPGAAPRQRPP